MFGSVMLEVAIGLIFMFLLFSLIMSAVCETIQAFMKSRARELERTIAELMQDPKGDGLRRAFYEHPLIYAMYRGPYEPKDFTAATGVLDFLKGLWTRTWGRASPGGANPSYIPRPQFVSAILDLWQSGKLAGQAQAALSLLSDEAKGDLAEMRLKVEGWYDGMMERVTGTYKRHVQQFMLVFGFVAAALLNLDAIDTVRALSASATLRDAVVAAAAKITVVSPEDEKKATKMLEEAEKKAGETLKAADEAAAAAKADPTKQGKAEEAEKAATDAAEAVARIRATVPVTAKELNDIAVKAGMPMGWTDPQVAEKRKCFLPDAGKFPGTGKCGGVWVSAVFGWAIMALAATLGAPFWFDMLSKFVNIRATLKSAEDSLRSPDPKKPSPDPKPASQTAGGGGGGGRAPDPVAPPRDSGGPIPDRAETYVYG